MQKRLWIAVNRLLAKKLLFLPNGSKKLTHAVNI